MERVDIMEKGKKIIIFLLINVLIIGITVAIPLIPTYKFYNAYHYDIPNNILMQDDEGRNMSAQGYYSTTTIKDLQTQEGKTAFSKLLKLVMFERGDIMYNNFVFVYIMFGLLIGVIAISFGIYLKYKSKNKIYAVSFIVAGIIVIIAYILQLSILLQQNVFYSLS